MKSPMRTARRLLLLTSSIACAAALALPSLSLGATPAPGWGVTAATTPTNLPPNGSGTLAIKVFNLGAGPSEGPVVVTDVLPPGIHAKEAGELINMGERPGENTIIGHELWQCHGNGSGGGVEGASEVTCVSNVAALPQILGGGGAPTYPEVSTPHPQPIIGIIVESGAEHTAAPNRVTVAGGGAASSASVEDSIAVSAGPSPFSFADWHVWLSNGDGSRTLTAGTHPYEATFTFDLARVLARNGVGEVTGAEIAGGEARNVEVRLPPGLIGNPSAAAQCTRPQLAKESCPFDSQIGIVTAYFSQFGPVGFRLFNMVPPEGAPAELAFNFQGVLNVLDASVATGGDFGVGTLLRNASQREISGSVVTLWGVPGDPSHNPWRSGVLGGCSAQQIAEQVPAACAVSTKPLLKPFLTLGTSCSGASQPFSIASNTWQAASTTAATQLFSEDGNGGPLSVTGCEGLTYGPGFELGPEVATADTPTGLGTEVNPSLAGLEEPEGRAASNTKRVTVVLPAGMTVNPGQAAGLQACQETAAQSAIGTEAPAACPAASKIGTVSIRSPLIETAGEKEFQGNVYILQSNPPQLHILVAASADGVNLKLVGIVHLDPASGRLTATFGENPAVEAEDPFLAGHLALPDLPFSSFKLNFDGGPRAALVSPARCGEYVTAADFTPWASPSIPDVAVNPAFKVTAAASGGACPGAGPLPFTPSMVAGTTNPVGGASSSFVLKVSKPDDQQNISAIDTTLPPGQLAKLAGVPLCPEAAAPSGNCPAASRVGSVAAAVGPGANPLQVPQPGKAPTAAYLAGPYKGAPYSLVFAVPAQAGPFDLGTVVTRVALQVDETTTQVTAKSDPLPQILDGVPLDYQSVTASIDRPDFIRNPTNCEPMKVTGTISGSEGAAAGVSNRYQIGDCASLAFKPSLKLSLKGATKRSGVPALKAVLTYPNGNNANIKSVSTVLPKSEFIDNAHIGNTCTRVQFNAGAGQGAECPADSLLGHAIAYSPLLDKPLEGNVYLRSNGGERELPDIVAALKGQIPVTLVGFIDSVKKNKHSEVSRLRTRFMNVPDAPVSRFVLKLAGAKHGLLENSANLCKVKNVAQVKAVGQNGKTYDTSPKVTNDCGKQGKKSKKKSSGRVGSSHR